VELIEVIRINLLSPMVLAFVLGIVAVLVKSDLKIPDQVYSIISIYLLFAIGLKGGFDLAKSPLSDFGVAAIVTIIIGAAIPLITFAVLKFFTPLTDDNIIAIGIHYGAVSAVTLSACITFLDEVGQPFEGFMPAMYVIMEIPAVVVGLILADMRVSGRRDIGGVVRSALGGKSFLLLGGGVLIGFLSGDLGERQVGPFFIDLFSGFLALFLLEMGTLVGKRIRDLSEVGIRLLIFAVAMPAFNALFGAWMGSLAGLSVGGTMILATLAASASFITAPAVVQNNLPRANPGYYLTTALVLTFPFNLIVGLPLYFQFALFFSGG
jgi:hypothetical protein